MKQGFPEESVFVPESEIPLQEALKRTTHLGIGAHSDDLEFMATSGILNCLGSSEHYFGGITCTDGRGSAREAEISEEELVTQRKLEQERAAQIGQYSFVAQLGLTSESLKSDKGQAELVRQLTTFLEASQPAVLYTHNPFDKHPTHLRVLSAVLEAVRGLCPEARPKRWIGCEVWRGLDWLPDELKVNLPVEGDPQLIDELLGCFKSQLAGGKHYDLAVKGRWAANATFSESHGADTFSSLAFGIDLSEFSENKALSLADFVQRTHHQFGAQLLESLEDLS